MAPIVPDVNSSLAALPACSCFYTAVGLSSAYFSVPVHPNTQDLKQIALKTLSLSWYTWLKGDTELLKPSCNFASQLSTIWDMFWKRDVDTYPLSEWEQSKTFKDPEQRRNSDHFWVSWIIAACGSLTVPPMTRSYAKSQWKTHLTSCNGLMRWDKYSATSNTSSAWLLHSACLTTNCDSTSGLIASAVLAQTHGDRLRPVAYYSKTLPLIVQGLVPCLRAVAASAIMVEKAQTSFSTSANTVHKTKTYCKYPSK